MALFNTPLSALKGSLLRNSIFANNVANLNTEGFKSSKVTQSDAVPFGTRVSSVSKDMSQGPLISTGESLHLAIEGEGFFRVSTPRGDGFTRSGTFQVDGNGNVVTPEGLPIQPKITVPPGTDHISIEKNGAVYASSGGESHLIGQIEITRFSNPAGLFAGGGSLYFPSANSGEPETGIPGTGSRGTITQGAIEGSNVSLVREFSHSIVNENNFKANINVLKTLDQMTREVLDIL